MNPFDGWGVNLSKEPPILAPGVTLHTTIFLVCNLVVFVPGLMALYLSNLVQSSVEQIKVHNDSSQMGRRQKAQLARSLSPLVSLIFVLSTISLIALYGVLASMGFAKFSPIHYTPLAVAVFGLILMVWGMIDIYVVSDARAQQAP